MQNRLTGGKVLKFTAFILIISFMLLLSACNKNGSNEGTSEIDLAFTPVKVQKLEVGKVAANMEQQKVFDFENIDGQKQISILLYTTPTTLSVPDQTAASTTPTADAAQNTNTPENSRAPQGTNPANNSNSTSSTAANSKAKPEQPTATGQPADPQKSTIEDSIKNTIQTVLAPTTTEVSAFLKEGDNLYFVGVVSRFGVTDVTVEANDWDQDKKLELNISGSMDTTNAQLRVIGFDKKSKSWANLAILDGPNVIDLDQDDVEELLSVSTVTQPSHVSILRWKKNHFETADVAKSTNNTYANLHLNNGQVEFEAGKDVNGSVEKHIYQYKAGHLIEPKTE